MNAALDAPTTYRPALDAAKVVSAIAIIFYHALAPGRELWYAGLVVFLCFSAALHRFKHEPVARTAKERYDRLLKPWLTWFLIYAVVNLANGAPVASGDNILFLLLAGPSIHLWYLPFIFLVLFIFDCVKAHTGKTALKYASLMAMLLFFAAAPYWRPYSFNLIEPIPQYWHAAPAVLLGLAFPVSEIRATPLKMVGYGAIVLSPLLAWNTPGICITYVAGFAVFFVSTLIQSRLQLDFLKTLSGATLGVYLCHPLIIRATRYLVDNPVAIALISTSLAFACVLFARMVFGKKASLFF
jgi:surface polysaccharide O-acyltransferase-like enzyme